MGPPDGQKLKPASRGAGGRSLHRPRRREDARRRIVLPARHGAPSTPEPPGKTTGCTLVLEIFSSLVAGSVVVCLRRTRGCRKWLWRLSGPDRPRPHRRAPWRRNARGRGRPRRSLRLRRRGLTMVTPPGPTTRTRRSSSTRRRSSAHRGCGPVGRARPVDGRGGARFRPSARPSRPGPIARRRQSAPARTRAKLPVRRLPRAALLRRRLRARRLALLPMRRGGPAGAGARDPPK